MERLMIIGTSTAARNVYLFVQKYKLFEVIGFAVNEAYKTCETYCEKKVYTIEKMDAALVKKKDYVVGYGDFMDILSSLWNVLPCQLNRMEQK